MDIEQNIKYWLQSAAHDLEAAETLYQNGKYDWCLFLGHLVIEKTIKAFYLRDNKDSPPKIHNILRLAEQTALPLSDEQKQLLMKINDFNIEARYPDQKFSFYKLCTIEFAEEYFTKIKGMHSWLLSQIKP
ncbi:MAG: HEPN domain-containing protein [Candidatus Schekmanbacteria bacterium]|nr:HEPN domain-containing protein [Candidatus Schekmanbacteria bacterium]